ncbi:MAG: sugar ABC transporter ATP-binding protein [Firmicutes bacterium]|nr:sugar ABC transporter ATP-binding protein [Candidatus Fermentithermobacillaceae bacterium]
MVLKMEGITKEFYGNPVLKNVSLDVKQGEIHGLVGENGAGKTTLMNILFGMPVIQETGGFSGRILFDGREFLPREPRQAMAAGIGMVHQEFMLIPGFSVTENIKLNREITRENLLSRMFSRKLETLDMPAMAADSRKAIDALAFEGIDEWAPVAGMPVGHKQFVEIAREIDKENVKLLVFDEPTAVLTESEAAILLDALKRLARRGIGILFISHRLDEVLATCDRITVLRDGEVVAEKKAGETTVIELAELMVGRKVDGLRLADEAKPPETGEDVLVVEDLSVNMPGERVRGVSFTVKRGEILGIGGLAGHGKLGIANGIMGLQPASGRVKFLGKEISLNDPLSALKAGLAFVSEDRRNIGLLLDETLEDNLVLAAMQVHGRFLRRVGPFAMRDSGSIRRHALETIKEFDIRTTGPRQVVRRLSGGNQQKVCIARAISLEPKLLLVSEPTRGIDVGAKQKVLEILYRLNREKGLTIIMTSSELVELRRICHRIMIMYDGKIAGILPPDASDAEFGLTMSGEKSTERSGEHETTG